MATPTPIFDKVSKEIILSNLLMRTWRHWRNEPLWLFIANACGIGSNSAIDICCELKINPHATVNSTTVRSAVSWLHREKTQPPPEHPNPKLDPTWDW